MVSEFIMSEWETTSTYDAYDGNAAKNLNTAESATNDSNEKKWYI